MTYDDRRRVLFVTSEVAFCDYCCVEPAEGVWVGRRIGPQCWEERAIAAVIAALLGFDPALRADEEERAWLMGDQTEAPPAPASSRTVGGGASRKSNSAD